MENMTNGDALQMFNGLSAVKQPLFADIKDLEDMSDYLFHAKFIQAVSYNKRKLTPLIESFQDSEKLSDEYKDYLKERNAILAKYARKDKEGEPIKTERRIGDFTQEGYDVPSVADKTSPAGKAIDRLEEKNKALIDERKKKAEEMEAMLKEPCKITFKFKEIPWSTIPKGLDTLMMDGVMFMIEDEKIELNQVIPVEKSKEKEKVKP